MESSYIIVIAAFAIIVSVLIVYYLDQKKKKIKSAIRVESLSGTDKVFYFTVSDLINKDFLKDELENLIAYDLFEGAVKEKIMEHISDMYSDNKLNFNHDDNSEYTLAEILDATQAILDREEVEVKIMKVFTDKVEENAREAEAIEKEAEEYHKSFGEEPADDPVLHPAEKSTDESYDMEEKSIDELSKTGTIEDI